MDNLPMNRTFFTKNIENIPHDKWINLRDWRTRDQICMMWQVATPDTWKQVFHIDNLQDIKETLINVNNNIDYKDGSTDRYWFTDQLFLYEKVMAWNKTTNNYLFLKDNETGFNRLCRSRFNISDVTRTNIAAGDYSDYHMLRPMSKYSDINWKIYNLLP
tara:strand:- start:1021 stop:1500 length:480 start_codon:yes stop_codon:yes gene_type:complete